MSKVSSRESFDKENHSGIHEVDETDNHEDS